MNDLDEDLWDGEDDDDRHLLEGILTEEDAAALHSGPPMAPPMTDEMPEPYTGED